MPITMIVDGIASPFITIDSFEEGYSVSFDVPTVNYYTVDITFAYFPEFPALMLRGTQGKGLTVVFQFENGLSTAPAPFMTIELTNAYIALFKTGASGDGLPYTELSFQWQTMKITTLGVGGTTATFSQPAALGPRASS